MKSHRKLAVLLAIGLSIIMPRVAWSADDGAKIFEDECSDCHNGKKKPLDKKQLNRKEWEEAIKTMVEKDKLDPVPSKERQSTLVDWLVLTRGPAQEPSADAAAIATAGTVDATAKKP
jgi:mono/diheme cytochrome c family protein